jgi:ATP-dependent Clp protease ATP-binding subunit ClpX
VAQLKAAPLTFQRGHSSNFHAAIAQEEEQWEEALRQKEESAIVKNFEEYKKKSFVAGAG